MDALSGALRSPSNRRDHPRYRIPLNVRLHCIPANAMSFEAEIIDMSRGGMAVMIFEATLNLPAGTIMKGCTFMLPGGEAVVVDVEVRNTSPIVQPGVGPAQRAGLKFLYRPKGIEGLLTTHGKLLL
jgi:hypothetical protein